MVSHYFQNTKKPQAGWDNTTWHARLLIKFISNSGHLIVPTSYYLPSLYHMLSLDYYSATVKFTDTQSSDIPGLCHILEYIICSTSCTSSVWIRHSTCSHSLICLLTTPPTFRKLRRRKSWEGTAHKLTPTSLSTFLYQVQTSNLWPPTPLTGLGIIGTCRNTVLNSIFELILSTFSNLLTCLPKQQLLHGQMFN